MTRARKAAPWTFVVLLAALPLARAGEEPAGLWARGDNHFHSKYSDGSHWPPDLKPVLVARGLHYAFLTDHTCLLPQDGREPRIYAIHAWDECAALSEPGFLFAQGTEHTNAHTYRHMCALPIYPPAFHHEQVGFTDFGNEGMMHREIHLMGGFSVLAHPAGDQWPWTSYNFDGVNIDHPVGTFRRTVDTHVCGMDTLFVADTDAHTLEQLANGGTTCLFVPELSWEALRDAHLARHAFICWDKTTELALKVFRADDYLGMQGDSIIAQEGETLTFRMEGRYDGAPVPLELQQITATTGYLVSATAPQVIGGGTFSVDVRLPMVESRIYYANLSSKAVTNHLRVKVEGKPDWHSIGGRWRWRDDRYEQTTLGTGTGPSWIDPRIMKANTRERVIPADNRPHQVAVRATILETINVAEEAIGLIGHRSFFPNHVGDRSLVLRQQQLWLVEEGLAWGRPVSFVYAASDTVWLKMRFAGDWVQGKAWHDGDPEPEQWMLARAFSDHEGKSGGPSGRAGLYAGRARVAFDDFSVIDDASGEVLFHDAFNTSEPTPPPTVTPTWRIPDPTATPQAPPQEGNLVPNSGGEQGFVAGWTTTGECAVVTSAFSRTGAPIKPLSGNYFFQLYSTSVAPSISRRIALDDYAADCAAGRLEFVAGFASASCTDYADDPAQLIVRQYDRNDTLLDDRSTGWLYDWFQARWNRYELVGAVHPWAASIEIMVAGRDPHTWAAGMGGPIPISKAFADDVFLYVRTVDEPRLPTLPNRGSIEAR